MQARTLLLGAAALATLACSGAGIPDPEPTAVDPARGFVGRATPVVIRGNNFQVRAAQPAGGGAPELDPTYRAWLGSTELTEVVRVDDQTLHATVPPGLPLGAQALRVQSPFGKNGDLANAFTVVGTAAGGLRATIAATPATVSVGQAVTVTLGVENTGTADVTSVLPAAPTVTGTGLVAANPVGPVPASIPTLAPGATGTFTWTYLSSGAGSLAFTGSASGTDAFSGDPLVAPTDPLQPAAVTVQRPATLSAVLSTDASVPLGGTFTVRMTVSNSGDAAALGVRPTSLTLSTGSVPASLVSGPTPAQADVPGAIGTTPGTVTFTWTWQAGTTDGTVQLTGGASGTDANSGTVVTAPNVLSNTAQVGRATLRATLEAPASVSVGQTFTLGMSVTNPGTAAVTNLAPGAPSAAGAGGITLASGPTPPSVPSLGPAQTTAFQWSYQATAAGQISVSATVSGTDSFSGSPVSTFDATPITVQRPAALEVASFVASRTSASTGQPVTMTLTLRNTGQASASVTSVAPSVAPAAGMTCTLPAPEPTPAAPVAVGGGTTATFTWTCTGTTAGARTLGATVAAVDANSLASVAPTVTGVAVSVQTATALTLTAFTASRASAATGQAIALTLTLANAAGAATANVTAVTPTWTPTANMTCTAAAPAASVAAPVPVAGGGSATFTWTCTGSAAGAFSLGATLAAVDAVAGTAITPPAIPTIPVTVQGATLLGVTAFTAGRATAATGQAVAMTLVLANAAGNATANVTGVAPTVTPAGATCTAATPAATVGAPVAIAAGASATFTWTCTGTAAGAYTLGVTVTAVNSLSGASVAPTVGGLPLTVQTPAALTLTSFGASRATAAVGQAVTMTLVVANAAGNGTANVTAVTPSTTSAANMPCTPATPAASVAAPVAVAAGTSATFTWTCTGNAAAAGTTFTLGATLAAVDANTAAAAAVPALTGQAVTVQALPVLTATSFQAASATAGVGQSVTVTLALANQAGRATANVTGVTPSATPAGMTCTAATPAASVAVPVGIAGGGAQTFTWTCSSTSAGTTFTLGATVTAVDANNGAAVAAPVLPAPLPTITVQSGASLVSTLTESLAPSGFASTGQAVAYTFAVQNLGSATANVTSVPVPTVTAGTATCTAPVPAASVAVPVPVAGGATVTFAFTCTPTAAGNLSVRATASGADANPPNSPVSTSASTSFQVQTAAAVTATSIVASPTAVSVGQAFTLTLNLSKTGTAAASVTAVALTGAPAGICTGPTPAVPVNPLPSSQAFQWTCTPTAAAVLTLNATATWVDLNANPPPATPPTATPAAAATVTVQTAAVVSAATPTSSRAVADTLQSFTLSMTVNKTGQAGATVSGITVSSDPNVSCTSPSPATPLAFATGTQAATFTWTCSASTGGSRTFAPAVSWTDANAPGTPRTSTPATGVSVNVQTPPALTVSSLLVDSPVPPGNAFNVTMTVTNSGQATANGVAPSALTLDAANTGTAAFVSGPTGSPVNIVGGGSASFTWTYQNAGAGSFAVRGGASGTSANSGLGYTAPAVTSSPGNLNLRAAPEGGAPAPEVALVAVDPLGDGTPAPLLAGWQGAAWVGPSRDGRTFARLDAAGSAARVSLAIRLDLGLTPMSNPTWTWGGRATTLGAAGCTAGSSGCGPDDEQGADALAAASLFGGDVLAATGSGGRARYLYVALAATSPLALAWVDLAAPLEAAGAAGPRRLAAVLLAPGAPDRAYLGLSTPAGARLLALERPPVGSFDAASGSDVLDLALSSAPGAAEAREVTALAEVEGVLYVGHDAGLLRGEVPSPGPASWAPADWGAATPSDPAWSARSPVALPATGPVLAGDRAIAALAAAGSCGAGPCVFLARNVRGAPTQPAAVGQLWRCSPSAAPARCEPGDWALALAGSPGDGTLTRAAETNGALSVLAATPRWLYVGFDDAATGVQLYRAAGAPRSLADLKGKGGCAAGSAGCEGLGGNGFGDARNARVLDARVLDAGAGPELWLLVGDGAAPASVHRVAE